uniref:Late embryogenesis abundant protein LEA-2 subgroup domain-containing protein n=1 Tax=Aegilops tauschii TaxID=37682 RepID=R7WBU6_AEGTA
MVVACVLLFIAMFFLLLITGVIMGICYAFPPGPDEPDDPLSYSAAIDSVSGLDPTMDRGLSSLDLSFNLTIRVTSMSYQRSACVESGIYVEVAYRRVILATSPTIQQQLCVGPKEATEHRLVARGTGVRVAGALLDSLVADMRQDVLVFQVTLRRSEKYDDDVVVKSCGGRQVGAAVVDLETMCKTPYPHKNIIVTRTKFSWQEYIYSSSDDERSNNQDTIY